MSVVIEGLLWLVILLSAYGQRDAWHAGNWFMFVAASCVGGAFALHLRSHYRATPLTLATQRAEAAEADARSAWVEYANEKEVSAQRLCYLRQSEDMVDTLTAERDALRADNAVLSEEIHMQLIELGMKRIGDHMSQYFRADDECGDAAMAVQP